MIDVESLEETGTRLATRLLREAFAHFPSGVVAVCGEADGENIGMAASSFAWVSIDPALVCFFAERGSRTWARLRELPRIGLSVLGSQQQALARQIASRNGDRFRGVELVNGPGGAPLVAGATAWFECDIYREVEAGDHTLVLLKVVAIDANRDVEPLIYHRSGFRALRGLGL